MDEEKLIRQLKEIMAKMTYGCDNLVELKSKCMYCICNQGTYEGKLLCTKKYDEKL